MVSQEEDTGPRYAVNTSFPYEKDAAKAFSEKICISPWTCLTDSKIHKYNADYYDCIGTEAWAQNQVPSFITSNAKLASDYATMCCGFIRDVYWRNPKHDKPVFLIELGAGHGRFSYYFLESIMRYIPMLQQETGREKPFKFIFTDFCQTNLDSTSKEPRLKKFIDEGWLDFAIFDAVCANYDMDLMFGGQVSLNEPSVIIANYLFDSLKSDVYYLENEMEEGKVKKGGEPTLHIGEIALFTEEKYLVDGDVPKSYSMFECMSYLQRYRPINYDWTEEDVDFLVKEDRELGFFNVLPTNTVDVLGEKIDYPKWKFLGDDEDSVKLARVVFDAYRKLCSEIPDATFMVPIDGIRLVRDIMHFTSKECMFLLADKGFHDARGFKGKHTTHIGLHGSISFMLNFHAIEVVLKYLGGKVFFNDVESGLQCRIYFGKPVEGYFTNTMMAYQSISHHYGSDMIEGLYNYTATLTNIMVQNRTKSSKQGSSYISPNFSLLNALIRYAHYDSEIVRVCVALYLYYIQGDDMSIRLRNDILSCLKKSLDCEFSLEESSNRLRIGQIFQKLGFLSEAENVLRVIQNDPTRSEKNRAEAIASLASCAFERGKQDDAEKLLDSSLEIDPTCSEALNMRQIIEMNTKLTPLRAVVLSSPECLKTEWLTKECVPAFVQAGKLSVDTVYCLEYDDLSEVASAVCDSIGYSARFGRSAVQRVEVPKLVSVQYGNSGLGKLLNDESYDIFIVDLPPAITQSVVTQAFFHKKHVFTRSALGISGTSLNEIRESYLKCLTKEKKSQWMHATTFWRPRAFEYVEMLLKDVQQFQKVEIKTLKSQKCPPRGKHPIMDVKESLTLTETINFLAQILMITRKLICRRRSTMKITSNAIKLDNVTRFIGSCVSLDVDIQFDINPEELGSGLLQMIFYYGSSALVLQIDKTSTIVLNHDGEEIREFDHDAIQSFTDFHVDTFVDMIRTDPETDENAISSSVADALEEAYILQGLRDSNVINDTIQIIMN